MRRVLFEAKSRSSIFTRASNFLARLRYRSAFRDDSEHACEALSSPSAKTSCTFSKYSSVNCDKAEELPERRVALAGIQHFRQSPEDQRLEVPLQGFDINIPFDALEVDVPDRLEVQRCAPIGKVEVLRTQ